MKTKKIITAILIIIVGLFCLWFFWLRNAREKRLTKEGYIIIEKIEKFKQEYNRLPNTLSEIGIIEKDETNPPLYYDKRDSVHFTISFGISLDDSKIYYSDSKKWEDSFREMCNTPQN